MLTQVAPLDDDPDVAARSIASSVNSSKSTAAAFHQAIELKSHKEEASLTLLRRILIVRPGLAHVPWGLHYICTAGVGQLGMFLVQVAVCEKCNII